MNEYNSTRHHGGFDWFISCEGLNKNSDHDWCFFTTISYLFTYSFIHSFIYYFSHLLQNPLRHDYITKGDGQGEAVWFCCAITHAQMSRKQRWLASFGLSGQFCILARFLCFICHFPLQWIFFIQCERSLGSYFVHICLKSQFPTISHWQTYKVNFLTVSCLRFWMSSMFRIPSSLRVFSGSSKQIFTSRGKVLFFDHVASKRLKYHL